MEATKANGTVAEAPAEAESHAILTVATHGSKWELVMVQSTLFEVCDYIIVAIELNPLVSVLAPAMGVLKVDAWMLLLADSLFGIDRKQPCDFDTGVFVSGQRPTFFFCLCYRWVSHAFGKVMPTGTRWLCFWLCWPAKRLTYHPS